MPDNVDPIIPFLAGAIHNMVNGQGRVLLKVVAIQPLPDLDGVTITFASGLRLKVHITELPAEERQQ